VSSIPSEDKGKGKAAAEVVVLLDSEDEEEGQVKRELSPSTSRSLDSLGFSAQSSNQHSHLASEVIDLTLDDDEDQTPPPPRPANKRTAESADLPDYHPTDTWKKNRTEVDHQHRPSQIVYQGSNHVEPRVHAPLPSMNGYAPPPPRAPPAALNPFSNYPNRQSLTESRQLPPINYNLPSRPNGGGPPRWS
jgi:E3 SUMO-protein ligase PIAS1